MKDPATLKIAVVTGWHPFDVPAFHHLWRSLPGVDAYLQDVENFAADWGGVRKSYDVLVFYNMNRELPTEGPVAGMIHELGESRQGLVVLHHALLAYPESPKWRMMTGVAGASFGYYMNQTVQVEIADADHPITRGMEAWEIQDETYTMPDARENSHVLLTATHPLSMTTLGWTRQYRESRVFCFQCGHDRLAWENPGFRETLARGIQWTAGRL